MPIYRYTHNCGIGTHEFFLEEKKESKIVPCYGCSRNVTARQVRDKTLKIGRDDDGNVGVLKRVKNNGNNKKRSL